MIYLFPDSQRQSSLRLGSSFQFSAREFSSYIHTYTRTLAPVRKYFTIVLCYRLRYKAHTTVHHTHVRTLPFNGTRHTYKYVPTHQHFTSLTIIATLIFISSTQMLLLQIYLTLSLTLLYLIIRSFSTQNS